jgi:hypothetical protein
VLTALFRELQGGSCQNSVGPSEFAQDCEVVCLYDRNQLRGEMRLSPISVEVLAGSNHRWQVICARRTSLFPYAT